MDIALVTGSGGLIGAESSRDLLARGFRVVGVDNDLRQTFFGPEASTRWAVEALQNQHREYRHHSVDIRDPVALERVFAECGSDLRLVVHTAAQPSHDWAAKDPHTDFGVNATGTLNLLDLTQRHAPSAVFIFTSTNKVYGDRPNALPLEEREWRYELVESHPFYAEGIDETMSIDQSLHSLFGVSKVAADLLVQEYGRYFGLRTVCFRGGCLTGPGHSGAELHGFLSYLMKCIVTGRPYTVYGYKGKQVRDNIHSHDLVSAFWEFYTNPRAGAVYNLGGGRFSNCSMLEAIRAGEARTGRRLQYQYVEANRAGDHIWYISNTSAFRRDYPEWKPKYDMDAIFDAVIEGITRRNS